MKNISKFALAAGIVLAMVFTLSCSSDDGDAACRVEDGALKGCIWERTYASTRPHETRSDWQWRGQLTSTLDFTSDSKATLNKKGKETLYMSGSASRRENDVNETTNYTYVYAFNIREGYTETNKGSKTLFSVSADFETLTWGGNKYTKRK